MTLIASHTARIADLANGTAELDNPEWWAQLTAAYANAAGTTAMFSQADLDADEEEHIHDAYYLASAARRAADGFVVLELALRRDMSSDAGFGFITHMRDSEIQTARTKSISQTKACAVQAAHCLALIEALEH